MLFDSLSYLVFLPSILLLYQFLPKLFNPSKKSRVRGLILLIASLYFYGSWNYHYLALLVGSIILDFYVGIRIEGTASKSSKRFYLLLSLFGNFGALIFFKYYNFTVESLGLIGVQGLTLSNFLLPVGISFYSFQTACYSIDVYMGNLKAERNLLNFSLYVSYFPQLVAGPIERAGNLLPQLREHFDIKRADIYEGVQRIFWGLFKKIVIANRASQMVGGAFAEMETASTLKLIIGAYAFAIQIYADFSAYSDIAIGTSKIMGVTLMKNFDRPYSSTSLKDFWRRWHISLSTWFRDYLYMPLGGNRRHPAFNLFVVFAISGIWHGANWTFVAWGLWHFTFLMLEQAITKLQFFKTISQNRFSKIWGHFITFHLVLIGWVFFRAESINDAFYYLQRMLGFVRNREGWLEPVNIAQLLILGGTYWFMDRLEAEQSKANSKSKFWSLKSPQLQLLVWAMIVYLGVFDGDVFIYFQF